MLTTLIAMSSAETVGVFFDATIPQITFAAGDVKRALESKGFTVEMPALSTIASPYANKKVVIALSSNTAVTGALTNQGGTLPSALGEQAYALRTTTQGQTAFWALGGDANGAMYGGLQVAENIQFNSFAGTYSSEEAPYVKNRGIKFNLPMDGRSPTYPGGNNGSSEKNAIQDVWDLTFWTTWFDQMARNRYNTLSIWTDHPFTSMINMPDYPLAALQDVKADDGTLIKKMTIDEKVAHWKQVMQYGHDRGFTILFINWNIFTHGATGQYGITNASANAATKTYMRKAMKQFFETYPNLNGFGVTAGENMDISGSAAQQWLFDTYGQGMRDYALEHPTRPLIFIARNFLSSNMTDIATKFKSLTDLPNVRLDMSFKYSQAHMYSSPVPDWNSKANFYTDLATNKLKTWFTVRNDDLFFLHWGDPTFAKAYINGFPSKDIFQGFYMGSDGNSPTRTYLAKNDPMHTGFEIQRLWYTYMLWGRLGYNPQTPETVFKNFMTAKYPGVSGDNLFTAWSKASASIPKVTELIQGTYTLDFQWWIEGCLSYQGFITVDNFAGAGLGKGSKGCSIATSGANGCGTAKSSYTVADEMVADATAALTTVNAMSAGADGELGVNLNQIRAMSYLSSYYAYKIRAATDKKAGGKAASVTSNLSSAYCSWMNYSNLMNSMFTGSAMQRVDDMLPDWHAMDANVLKEYNGNGGTGTPTCPIVVVGLDPAKNQKHVGVSIHSLSAKALSFSLPSAGAFSYSLYTSDGERILNGGGNQGKAGINNVSLETKLNPGIYLLSLKFNGSASIKNKFVITE